MTLFGHILLSPSLADPPAASVLLPAVSWLEGTLVGALATAAATVAIAAIGFMLLSGRVSVRRGAAAVLGSFILFGASTIAGGISGSLHDGGTDPPAFASPAPPPAPAVPPPPAPAAAPAGYDPFAGASVPTQ